MQEIIDEVNKKLQELVDGAPENLDTLKEIADHLIDSEGITTTLLTQIGEKIDRTEVADKLAEKADKRHMHEIAEVNGLEDFTEKINRDVQDKVEPIKTELKDLSTNVAKYRQEEPKRIGVEVEKSKAEILEEIEGKIGEIGNGLTISSHEITDDGVRIQFSDNSSITILKGKDGATGEQEERGEDGESAYNLAVRNGFTGDETAWLASLKGERGEAGLNGSDGAKGAEGESIKITNIEKVGASSWGGWFGTAAVDSTKVTFSDGQSISLPHGKDGAKGERGEQGIQGKAGRDGQAILLIYGRVQKTSMMRCLLLVALRCT